MVGLKTKKKKEETNYFEPQEAKEVQSTVKLFPFFVYMYQIHMGIKTKKIQSFIINSHQN